MKKLFTAIMVLGLLAFTAPDLKASHYRYGNMTWRVIQGRTVEITVTSAWRSGFIGSAWLNDNAGNSYTQISNQVVSNQNGVATRVQKFTTTYSSDGPFRVYWSSCCRIGGLANSGSSWYLFTTVDLRNNNENSPVSSLPPIVNVQDGLNTADFQIPSNDADGDALTYRLATFTEMGNGNQPPGFSISSTGEASLNTALGNYAPGQLYFAGVVVSDGHAEVMIDFLIRITQTSTPPVFDYGPTPANNTVYQVAPGQNVNFTVQARDNDPGGSINSLFVSGNPGGSSFPVAAGNPASSSFNWTPSAADFGTYVLNFTAQDNIGVQASTSVVIQVSLKPKFDVPPTPAQGTHLVSSTGQNINFTVQASDPDPNDLVQIISATGKDANGNAIPLYNGASFSTPTASGNPTTGTFNWTTQAGDWGHKHVIFTAEDGFGDRTKHEVSLLIDNDPAFTSTPVTSGVATQNYQYNVTATDPDLPFGDALSLYAFNLPSWLSFTDNGDGTGSLSGTPTLADAGTYQVEIEAQDIYHHHGNPSPRQSFTITVSACLVNAQPKNISIALDSAGQAYVSPADLDNGSSATCGIQFFSLSRYTFGCGDVGQNVAVDFVVTDVNGNVDSAVAYVSVSDQSAPTITCSPLTVQASDCLTPLNLNPPTVTDNCSYTGCFATDNLEGYASQSSLNQAEWIPWSANATVGQVSTDQAHTGKQSAKFTYGEDQIYLLGGKTSGRYDLSFHIYVPQGSGAYYNLQHFETPGIEWAHQVIFSANGNVQMQVAGQVINNPFPHDQWIEVRQSIDLDTKQTTLQIGNNPAVSYNFDSQPFTAAAGANEIGGINFYPVAAGDMFYIDDISFCSQGGSLQNSLTNSDDASGYYGVGTHQVTWTATDAAGNQSSCVQQVTVLPEPLVTTISSPVDSFGYNISCAGATDGSIDISVSEGCGPYSYAWSNGDTAQDLSGLGAGTYRLTITDAVGTTAQASITLSEPPAINATASASGFLSGPGVTGYTHYYGYSSPLSLNGAASGGVGSYQYAWSGAAIQQGANAATALVDPEVTTTYTLTVTDASGCVGVTQITVNVVDVTCGKKGDKVALCHNGKTICVSKNAVASHLAHANHKKWTCSLGPCTGSAKNEAEVLAQFDYHLFPNPTQGEFTLQVHSETATDARFLITDVQGRVIALKEETTAVGTAEYRFDLSAYAPGVYMLNVITPEQSFTERIVKR